MTLTEEVQKMTKILNNLYGIVTQLVFGIVFYILWFYLKNPTYNLILLIPAVGLFSLGLFRIGIFYFFRHQGNLSKYRRGILFSLLGILIVGIFIWLYLHEEGFTTLFLGTSIPSVIMYLIALVGMYSS